MNFILKFGILGLSSISIRCETPASMQMNYIESTTVPRRSEAVKSFHIQTVNYQQGTDEVYHGACLDSRAHQSAIWAHKAQAYCVEIKICIQEPAHGKPFCYKRGTFQSIGLVIMWMSTQNFTFKKF